jgi:hypothetical protein
MFAEDIEDFNNQTVRDLQEILEKANELGLSEKATTALAGTLESIGKYQADIASIENWGQSTQDIINKIFNDNGEWANIWSKFSAS